MSTQTKEARINLAIKAILTANKISVRLAAKTYNVLRTTLAARLTDRISQADLLVAHESGKANSSGLRLLRRSVGARLAHDNHLPAEEERKF